jgi:hypothetical protein
MNDLHEKFEQALAHLVQELNEEIGANNEEIQKLGHHVYTLEEDNDKLRDESTAGGCLCRIAILKNES